MDFSWFDIVIIIIILALGIKGTLNGFIKEIFSLIGVVGGVFVASRFAYSAGDFISENIHEIQSQPALHVIGFVFLFAFIWLVCFLIGLAVSKVVNIGGFTTLNKILGFLFSSIKIFLIFAVLAFLSSNIAFLKNWVEGAFDNSFMYKTLVSVGEQVIDIHPSDIPEKLEDAIEPIINKSNDIIETINANSENLTTAANDTIKGAEDEKN